MLLMSVSALPTWLKGFLTMSSYLRFCDFGRVRYKKNGQQRVVKPFHEEIGRALELVIADALPDGKKNLLITLPPRFGKTDMVAKEFPAYCHGHIPDCEFIIASCTKRLARSSSSDCKNIMSQGWYQDMFPDTRIARSGSSKGAADHFFTTMGGSVYASGAEGTIIGFGAGKLRDGFAGAFIIDDPTKPLDARYSVARETAVDFYNGGVKPRLNGRRTPIIMIMQRLHPDDLAGYVLRIEPADWHHISFPALDETLDISNWEERKSTHDLLEMREVDPTTFYTQFQQYPVTPGGQVLKEKWWKYYTHDMIDGIESDLSAKIVVADTAYKTKQENDFSVLQCWGFIGPKALVLLDQDRGRWEFPELLKHARQFWYKHTGRDRQGEVTVGGSRLTASRFYIEDKVSGTSLIQTLQRENIEAVEWNVRDYDIPEDKVSRAKETSFLLYRGCLFIPDRKLYPWVPDFIQEHSDFSEDMSHTHDDQVDGTTSAALIWKSLGGGAVHDGE
jgi:predicted phage terminase large subunit-like protein